MVMTVAEVGMAVDVIIVSFNTKDLLQACLHSVEAVRGEVDRLRTVVVDNASHDGSPEMVRAEFPHTLLVALEENVGFGEGNNRGLAVCDAEYVLFLNSDAELTSGALPAMLDCLRSNPRRVAVGPRLIYPDGTFQASCRRFPTFWRNAWSLAGMEARWPGRFPSLQNWLAPAEHASTRAVEMVSGACFLARRDYMASIGGFDGNMFLYEEEPDIFMPAKKRGMEVWFCAEATVIHGAGGSVKMNRVSDFSRFHLYRSKYYRIRKHQSGALARVTWWTDNAILAWSEFLNRTRGTVTDAREHRALCRKAFAHSSRDVSESRSPSVLRTDEAERAR